MTNVHEEWRPVVGYEGIYEVSSCGRVRRTAAKKGATVGRVQKPRYCGALGRQYQKSALYNMAGERADHATHRLVALAFLGPPPRGHVVNHKDGNAFNNHVSNLEWVTFRENIQHAWDTGLQKGGESHPRAKLTEQDVREIRNLSRAMSQRAIADRYSMSKGAVQGIIEGKSWKHVI